MTTLYDLPKDILIKLILLIETLTRIRCETVFQKEYNIRNRIFRTISDFIGNTYERLEPIILRCAVKGCNKIEVWNDKYGLAQKCYSLETCQCRKRHYCDVHIYEQFSFVKDEYDEHHPVCDICLPEMLEKGCIVSVEYPDYISKKYINKIKKKRLLYEEEKRAKEGHALTLYTLSKEELVEKFIYARKETKKECFRDRFRETEILDRIENSIYSLIPKQLDLKIYRCQHKGCRQARIVFDKDEEFSGSRFVRTCIFCERVTFCNKHITRERFPKTLIYKPSNHPLLYICETCKDKSIDEVDLEPADNFYLSDNIY